MEKINNKLKSESDTMKNNNTLLIALGLFIIFTSIFSTGGYFLSSTAGVIIGALVAVSGLVKYFFDIKK